MNYTHVDGRGVSEQTYHVQRSRAHAGLAELGMGLVLTNALYGESSPFIHTFADLVYAVAVGQNDGMLLLPDQRIRLTRWRIWADDALCNDRSAKRFPERIGQSLWFAGVDRVRLKQISSSVGRYQRVLVEGAFSPYLW